mgnify:CR=1 FL=1
MLAQLQPQLQAAGMQLTLTLPAHEEDSDIRADPDRVRQIVTNLVSNAIRHAGSGHWLGISVVCTLDEAGERCVELLVDDAGPGLPQEIKAHPFQRFAQLPGKRRREGSGLGLSIAQKIAEAHGGTLTLTDNVPHGCIFTFTLPLSEVTLNE